VTTDPDERADALARIVVLMRAHGLTVRDVAGALGDEPVAEPDAPVAARERRRRAILIRVFAILGGTFVFAGIGVFIALQWEALNAPARVVVTLGSGIAALVLALLACRDRRFEKATAPLFLIAAALEPTGMMVAFDEYGAGGDWRWASLITAGAMALQFGAVFARFRWSTPLFVTILFAVLFWWTAFDLLDMDGTLIAIVLGTGMLLVALWADRSGHRDITPIWYLAGAVAFLGGFADAVDSTPYELSFLAVAVGFVVLAAALQSRTLLFVATLAILAYTGYYSSRYFADSIGWPLTLIAFGLFMIGLSALAYRVDRDYVRKKA
jgi:hypothetical protein